MTKEQKLVQEFMLKADQECPAKPTIPDLKTRKLRAKLMLEETLETINKGLGLAAMQESGLPEGKFELNVDDVEFIEVNEPDLVELADGLGDNHVVSYCGTANAFGIDMEPIFEEIHETNMKKFGPGGYKDDFGKWRKPPDWQPPKIKEILDKQINS